MKNRKFKRILSLALSALIVLGVFVPGTEIFASAATGTYGDVRYDITNGEATIIGRKLLSTKSDIEIPSTIKGCPVTNIKSGAFHNTNIKSIIIPDSVTIIGNNAFGDCTNLTNVTLGNGLIYIGSDAFYRCTGLTSITIPDSVTAIDSYAFSGCTGLTSVTLGNGLIYIGSYAFSGCTGLKSITIPDSVTGIGSYAFSRCTGLTSVTIPNSVTNIGSSPFSGCTGLISIIVGRNNPNYSSDEYGVLFNIDKTELIQYPVGSIRTSYSVPYSVTSIGDSAFSGCSGLKNITLGNSLTSIGSYAFSGCTGLTSITIPDSVTSIGNSAFSGCTGLTSITIPDSVTSIGSYAFSGCTGLTSITIPGSVTSIGSSAFYGCTGLTKAKFTGTKSQWATITFGDRYSNPAYYAEDIYINNEILTDVTVINGTESINAYAFYNCKSINNVVLPGSVLSIGSDAFYNCTELKKVKYTGTVSQWATINFGNEFSNPTYYTGDLYINDDRIRNIALEKNVDKISSYAFINCKYIHSVIIPDSVTDIGNCAFKGCTGLVIAAIPDSVTSIGASAFYDCQALQYAIIPDNTETIGSNAFYNVKTVYFSGDKAGSPWGAKAVNNNVEKCFVFADETKSKLIYCSPTAKGNIVIPNSVTSIGESAFNTYVDRLWYGNDLPVDLVYVSCTDITGITIPDSVTSIGGSAFYDCTGLQNVYYTGTVGKWVTIDFSTGASNPVSIANNLYINGELLKTAEIEDGTESINAYAFYNCKNLKSAVIPASVTSIGEYAFYGCSCLNYLIVPNSVETIGDRAFYDVNNICYQGNASGSPWGAKEACCVVDGYLIYSDETKSTVVGCLPSAAGEIEIPAGVTSIDESAFKDCTGITAVSIPDSVTSIGDNAFAGCTALESVTVPGTATLPAGLTSIGNGVFSGCTALTSFLIPKNITSVGTSAFENCAGLKSVSILGNISKIEKGAFENCTGLTNVIIRGNVSCIGESVFNGCTSLESIALPSGLTDIKNGAFSDCTSLSDAPLPSGLTNIGNDVFYGCTSLDKIAVDPDSQSFSTDSFGVLFNKDKTKLVQYPFGSKGTEYKIPGSVTEIGELAFHGCTGLTDVTIPSGVTTIDSNAFSGCTSLENVVIPNSVTSIGENAFKGVQNVTYNKSFMRASGSPWGAIVANGYAENGLVYSDSSKTTLVYCLPGTIGDVVIPDSVKKIEDYAFYYCYNLTSITIPDSVEYIGANAFEYCVNLTNVTISDGVEYIGAYAFQYCDSLISLNIPNSVQTIGENAFINIMSITYDPEKMLAEGSPWGAKSTQAYFEGDFVYYDNSKAMLIGCLDSESETITVPDCVEAVDGYAFTLCDNLETLTFASPQIVFSPDTLVGCSSVQTVSSANTSGGITYTNYNPNVSYAKGGEVHYAGENGILFADRTMSGTYSVPDSISFICPEAFATCSGLEISIPDSVTLTSIGKNAFYNSKNYVDWSKSEAFQIGNYLIETAKTITSFAIPENIICIADGAFDGCLDLSSVSSLGRKLLSVGKSCFRGCSKLKTVSIPDTVRYVGSSAFEDTPITASSGSDVITVGTTLVSVPLSTTEYEVPDNITCIADGAFRGCELMTSVTVPDSITALGEDCFAGCLALKEITIPENTASIGKNAFKDCVSLTKINIPENVEKIDYTAFYGCSGIDEFSVSESNGYFSSENGLLMSKDKTELLQYPASKEDEEYTIPLNVSFIESLAFRKCLKLSRISIPKGIKYGYKNPFENCNLENRLYNEEGFDDYNNTVYYISNGKWELVSVTQKINGTYVVEKEVTTIRDGAFKDQTGITEIVFNDKLSVIGEEAFMGCTGLTEINIPAGVTRIEKSAFEDCTNLKKVTFGTYNGYENEALESVGEYAFANTGTDKTENVFGPGDTRYKELFVNTDAFHKHTPGEPKITIIREASCTKEGRQLIETRCTDEKCRKEFKVTEDIPKTKHNYVDKVTPPSCEEKGFTTHTCVCGDTYTDNFVDPLGHTPAAPVIENAINPDCIRDGSHEEVIYCSVCGTEISRTEVTDKAYGHTAGSPVIENETFSSCAEAGTYELVCYCSECGEELSREKKVKELDSHISSEAIVENMIDASCTCDGKYDSVVYCQTCHRELSRETVIVKAEGHQYVDNVTEPTCDKQGFTTHTCICGDSYVDNYTDALGHSFSHYVFNNDAAVGKDGTETAKCDRCSETDIRTAVGTAKKEAVIAIRNMAKYNGKSIDYKSTVTFFADTENCKDIQWYVNGRKVDANADGSCTVTKAQDNIEVYFTAKDEDGNTVKSETEKITVKHGFFDKLIAFFRGLFGLLPVITQ